MKTERENSGGVREEAMESMNPPLFERETIKSFYCLWKASGFGSRPTERAAWVVQDSEGNLSLEWWPWSATPGQETYSGTRPAGAVGIVHTHPNSSGHRPSSTDRNTAENAGLPVYVVTRRGIWGTRGGSNSDDFQVAGRGWFGGFSSGDCNEENDDEE